VPAPLDTVVFGGGCFWGVQAVFQHVNGVMSATSGYAGGATPDPTYKEVCSDDTGHAEVIQIEFDPGKVSFEKLLEVFWAAHDPTTLNRQGADQGIQYRSVILYQNEAQKAAAEKSMTAEQKVFGGKIVTQIVPLTKFYPAEKYHQNYYRDNTYAPYCMMVITPKLKKLEEKGVIN
jgi:peptide-methionine (S)-S-oxide reductase